ncbi:hypothetical protein BRD17_01795 [Halobacteriales archaeon SW_7_68_16]|nr:MAG: hypothetical protein BRD17_01795 [Halobacteriales archaeon SW_7_68_16]
MALNVEMVRNGELPWQDGRESFVGSGIGEDRVREVADEHGRRRFDLARSAVEFRKEGHDPGTALKLALDER